MSGRGGHCERRVFCSVAEDGVSGCPLYEGCFKHEDCRGGEFCWSWSKCQEEDATGTGGRTQGRLMMFWVVAHVSLQATVARSLGRMAFAIRSPPARRVDRSTASAGERWLATAARLKFGEA